MYGRTAAETEAVAGGGTSVLCAVSLDSSIDADADKLASHVLVGV